MIIYTAKFSKKKAVAILCAIAIVIAAIILATPEKEGQEAFARGIRAENGEDVKLYINSLGYEAEGEESCKDVVIPREFDEVYENYNNMQKECGFDLSGYKGRKATLYTYHLSGYPNCDEDVLCDVLVCKGQVIGGNIYTLRLDGFMHGLKEAG